MIWCNPGGAWLLQVWVVDEQKWSPTVRMPKTWVCGTEIHIRPH